MADVTFVNGTSILITSARNLKFVTTKHILSQTVDQLIKILSSYKVIELYVRGGFVIHVILMYMDFENTADKLGKVEINTSEVQEHLR